MKNINSSLWSHRRSGKNDVVAGILISERVPKKYSVEAAM